MQLCVHGRDTRVYLQQLKLVTDGRCRPVKINEWVSVRR